MSLHRVMAEIKSIEEKLALVAKHNFVSVVKGESRDDAATAVRLQFITDAKSALDKSVNMIKNLASLKSARNKANASLTVVINGKAITIDEALAQKAAIIHKNNLIEAIVSQLVLAQRQGLQAEQEIEVKVAAQLVAMFNNTRKATEDELTVIRNGFERSLKPIVLAPEGLKTTLDNMKNDVDEFVKEIDFVLSEANALNKIDVVLV